MLIVNEIKFMIFLLQNVNLFFDEVYVEWVSNCFPPMLYIYIYIYNKLHIIM